MQIIIITTIIIRRIIRDKNKYDNAIIVQSPSGSAQGREGKKKKKIIMYLRQVSERASALQFDDQFVG